jgi:hypothetical protein
VQIRRINDLFYDAKLKFNDHRLFRSEAELVYPENVSALSAPEVKVHCSNNRMPAIKFKNMYPQSEMTNWFSFVSTCRNVPCFELRLVKPHNAQPPQRSKEHFVNENRSFKV